MPLIKLLNILLILWTPICSLSNNSSTDTSLFENRVLGGFTCSTEEFGFMVVIMKQDRSKTWQRKCGGSLIRAKWVLTAGHCLQLSHPDAYLVVAALNDPKGEHKSVKSKGLFTHPEYDSETLINDIALIKLENAIERSAHVHYMNIPLQPYKKEHMEGMCKNALVLGWGYTSNNKDLPDLSDLQCAFLPLLATNECKKMYSLYKVFEETNICTLSKMGKDACTGDSGGPLLCGAVQTGVVSWGVECGIPTNPGIFTRVDQYAKFIQETIESKSRGSGLCIPYSIIFLFLFLINFVV